MTRGQIGFVSFKVRPISNNNRCQEMRNIKKSLQPSQAKIASSIYVTNRKGIGPHISGFRGDHNQRPCKDPVKAVIVKTFSCGFRLSVCCWLFSVGFLVVSVPCQSCARIDLQGNFTSMKQCLVARHIPCQLCARIFLQGIFKSMGARLSSHQAPLGGRTHATSPRML